MFDEDLKRWMVDAAKAYKAKSAKLACPLCGGRIVYQGLVSIECDGQECPNQIAAPTTLDWTLIRLGDTLCRTVSGVTKYYYVVTADYKDGTVGISKNGGPSTPLRTSDLGPQDVWVKI